MRRAVDVLAKRRGILSLQSEIPGLWVPAFAGTTAVRAEAVFVVAKGKAAAKPARSDEATALQA